MRSVSTMSRFQTLLFTILSVTALNAITALPAFAALPIEDTQCILGWPDAPNGLNCTANDTTLSSPTVVTEKPCNYPGDTARLNVTVDITVGAQTRYDLSVWLAVDGDPNGDGAQSGICSVLTVPNNEIHVDQITSTLGDGDQCGDVFNVDPDGIIVPPTETAHILQVNLGTVDLLCEDADGDGKINVPVIVAWKQGSQNDCAVSTDALPGTASKCVQDDTLEIDVPIPALLIVNKDTLPDDAQTFNFNLTGPNSGFVGGFDGDFTFPLTDNGVPADATWNSGQTTFVGGLPADVLGTAYVLSEVDPDGWISVGTCFSDIDGTNTDPANLLLRPGETVICDYLNIPSTGELTIRKLSLGGLDTFNFDVSDADGTVASPVLNTNDSNPVDSTTMVLEFGTYDITETIPAGWSLTGASCDGGQGSWTPGDTDITGIALNPGDSVICTFTNAALGSVSINKVAHGGDALFGFTTDIGGSGTFDITTTSGAGSAPAVTGLAADIYRIWETTIPEGWEYVSAVCIDEEDLAVVSVPIPNGVEFAQGDGQTTSCTFTNKKQGTIIIKKVTNPAGNVTDSFTFDNDAALLPATFQLKDNQIEVMLFVPVNDDPTTTTPYTISEQDPTPGFDLTDVTCESSFGILGNNSTGDVSTRTANIAIRAGEAVACTFTNTQRASINVAKQISANPNGLPTVFAFTTDFGAPFNLDPANTADMDFTGLAPDVAYMVAETNPNAQGWALISATCGTQAEAVNLSTGVISNIIPGPGDAINCVFINAPLGSATIVKNAVGGDDTFGFIGSLEPFNNGGAGFAIDTAVSNTADFTNLLLPNQIYDVQEDVIPANWTLTDVTCVDATNDSVPDGTEDPPADPALGAFIQAAVNETVTCTFTNEADATLIIEKATFPPSDTTTQFAFTGTGALTGNLVGGGSASETAAQGTFVADETPTEGWALTNIQCSGVAADKITIGGTAGFTADDTDVSVDLAPGETATCIYTNTKLGSITIEKATVGDVGAFTFTGTDVDNDAGIITSPYVLSTDTNDADPLSIQFSGLLPGQYLFSETVPGGWEIDGVGGDIVCTGPDGFASPWTPGSNSLDMNLLNGEDLVCTFTNTRPATIIVEKITDPTTSTAGFSFTGDVAGGPITHGQTLTTEFLSPGQYQAMESAATGWDLTDITCDDSGSASPSTGDTVTRTATFNAEAGEIVTCTFTNTIQLGKIIVDKVTTPANSAQSFDFVTNYGGLGFSLTDTDAPNDSGDLLPTSEAGTYSVVETVPNGWVQDSVVCTGTDGAAKTATAIDLLPGETVRCTFNNSIMSANIVVQKVTNPAGSAQSFTFQPSWGASFPLVDGGSNDSGSLLPTSESSTYNVSESVPDGWTQTSAVCDGTNNTPASITLLPGETVTCTFTNTIQPGQIIVDKQTAPTGSPQLFDFTLTGTNTSLAFQLADATTPYNSGNLLPTSENGTYNVSESLPTDWSQVSATCNDGSLPSAVNLSPGETVTCTFVNAEAGVSTFTKVTIGGDDTFAFTTDLPSGNFSLTTSNGISPPSGGVSLDAGSYTITEDILASWQLTDLVCTESDTQDTVVDIPNRTITLNVQEGETINCTVTNTKLGSITVSKATIPAGDQTSFTFAGDVAGAIADGGTIVVSDLLPGAYTSTESAVTGWDLTGILCDDGASNTPSTGDVQTLTATFNLDAGENVICQFTNTLLPIINLAKTVVGSAVLEANGTYTVVYTITASNSGGPGTYDLVDMFSPGTGITLNTASAVYLAGTENSQNGVQAPYPNFVTGEGLAAGLNESWTVTANFTVDPATLDPATSQCDPGQPVINTGFYNAVSGSDTETDMTDNATCTGLQDPVINLAKTVNGPATLQADGSYVVEYTITATNTGGPGTYDLVDTFSPGAGITLNTATAIYVAGTESAQTGTTGTYPNFVTTEGLGQGLNESWRVVANFTVDPVLIDPQSSKCEPTAPVINTGFYNAVSGSSTDVNPADDATCTGLLDPIINLAKTVNGPATLEADGSYTVEYTITATNTGGPGAYDLIDTFSPGSGITLDTATAAYVAGTEDSQSGTLGAYPNFVTGEGLAEARDESWTVTASFTVDPAVTDPATSACATSGSAIDTGFYNLVEGSATDSDLTDNDACTDLPQPGINLAKTVNGPAVRQPGGTYTVTYTITATNTGQGPGVYDLVDAFTPGVGITLDTADAVYLAGTEDDQSGTLGAYPNFVTGEALVAGMDESWTVTAVFSIDMALVTAEGNDCDPTNAGGDNTGFTNGVTGSSTDTDLTDNNACTEFIPPAISLDKTSDVATYELVGDVINYDYLITNLGPDVLDPGLSSVVDDKETVTCPAAVPLLVGDTVTCTASHVITQADLLAGLLTNVATAMVDDVTSNEDTVTVTATTLPPVYEPLAVPVNDKLALLLLTLMLMATGWYFRPAGTRKF